MQKDPSNHSEAEKPNIIWVFGDQHRAQALGCAGDPNVHTPYIDNLATMGVRFINALSGTPLCCPCRGSLLTSRYPHHCVPGHECRLPPEQKTIAHAFNDAGYHTAYFGKWHLDGFKEQEGRAAHHIVPPERRGGFTQWVGYENNNSQWDCWVHGGQEETAFHERLDGYETDALTDILIEYVEEQGTAKAAGQQQPFFAVLSVQPPHNPYAAPADFRQDHNRANVQLRPNVPPIPQVMEQAQEDLAGYYAMIENLDWNFGRITEALKNVRLDRNTHIIFFSDHGDMHGSHGQFKKLNPFEESIRVPFIIGGEQPAYDGRSTTNSPALINHVDVAPTTLGMCGIDQPDWMEGTDYSSHRLVWRPRAKEPDSAFLQSVIPTGHGDSVDKPWRGIVTTDGWKYVCFENISWLLFNLNEDPYEFVNLAHNSRYKSQRKRLNDRLKQWIIDTDDSFPLPDL